MIWTIYAAIVLGMFLAARLYAIRLADRRASAFQNDLVLRHYSEVKNMYNDMRGWRHDYRNHIQTLLGYGTMDRIQAYLHKLDTDLTNVDTLISTGNITLDAILNSKLSLAASKDIQVNAKATVPENLSISDIDLCVVVGNLLDNAIEACEKIRDNEARSIRVYIDVRRGHLYISVMNSTSGRVLKIDGVFKTIKTGFHGFGIKRIDKVVDRHGGYIHRAGEEGAFTTEITLPL